MRHLFVLFFLVLSVNAHSKIAYNYMNGLVADNESALIGNTNQEDTLSYRVTSVFNSGCPRTDRTELLDKIIINAFYADGVHYYWTMELSPDEQVKKLIEYEYAEQYNFSSLLTIKISNASYSKTVYTGYGVTVNNTSSTPEYTLDKIIKVYPDKIIVYKYSLGQVWWTYFYNKEGVIQYGINGGVKHTYKIDGDKLTEETPDFEPITYTIYDDGMARKDGGGDLSSWVDAEIGKVVVYLKVPKSKR